MLEPSQHLLVPAQITGINLIRVNWICQVPKAKLILLIGWARICPEIANKFGSILAGINNATDAACFDEFLNHA